MTPDAGRVAAIAALGYTDREAAFLDRVARHSGYFVRRQFLQYIGRATGQTVVDFTRKLVWRRHATVQTFCHVAQIVSMAVAFIQNSENKQSGRHIIPQYILCRIYYDV